MKRIIKILSIALCVVMLGVLLCSCAYLDEKKANRAIYCDDSKTSFTFRDYTYKKIKLPSNISFIENGDYYTDAYVTTKDVPVLLKESYGDRLMYPEKEQNPAVIRAAYEGVGLSYRFFNTYHYNEREESVSGTFVREDKYDDLNDTIKTAELDHYYIVLYNHESLNDYSANNGEYEGDAFSDNYNSYTNELISDEVTNAIIDSLKKGERIHYSKVSNSMSLDSLDALMVSQCDKDVLFTNGSAIYLFKDDKNFYLIQTVNDSTFGTDVVKAPDEYSDLFGKLFSKYSSEVFPFELEDFFYYYSVETAGEGNSET